MPRRFFRATGLVTPSQIVVSARVADRRKNKPWVRFLEGRSWARFYSPRARIHTGPVASPDRPRSAAREEWDIACRRELLRIFLECINARDGGGSQGLFFGDSAPALLEIQDRKRQSFGACLSAQLPAKRYGSPPAQARCSSAGTFGDALHFAPQPGGARRLPGGLGTSFDHLE